jgi:hypothetical protein
MTGQFCFENAWLLGYRRNSHAEETGDKTPGFLATAKKPRQSSFAWAKLDCPFADKAQTWYI